MNNRYPTLIGGKNEKIGCFYLCDKKAGRGNWKWLEKKIPLHFFLLFLLFFLGAFFSIYSNPFFLKDTKGLWLASTVSFSEAGFKADLDFHWDSELQPSKLPLANKIVYGLPLSSNKEEPKEEKPKPKKLFSVIKSTPSLKTFKLEKNDYPELAPIKEEYKDGKYIEVDISKQVMAVYGSGELKGLYKVSTGMPGMRTPAGNFKVLRKSANVWSVACGCWMPYAMEFKSGLFIHELPYWPGKGREGEAHLGQPVSHGCVRLGIGPAKEVFDFAEIGTPVTIRQ